MPTSFQHTELLSFWSTFPTLSSSSGALLTQSDWVVSEVGSCSLDKCRLCDGRLNMAQFFIPCDINSESIFINSGRHMAWSYDIFTVISPILSFILAVASTATWSTLVSSLLSSDLKCMEKLSFHPDFRLLNLFCVNFCTSVFKSLRRCTVLPQCSVCNSAGDCLVILQFLLLSLSVTLDVLLPRLTIPHFLKSLWGLSSGLFQSFLENFCLFLSEVHY